MSCIYPARVVKNGQKTRSSQYADRNLELVWGTIRESGIYAAPTLFQLDYGVYRANLSAWMQATALGERVLTASPGHSLHNISLSRCVNFVYPPISLQFKRVLDAADEDVLYRDFQAVKSGSGRNAKYFVNNPSVDTIRSMMGLKDIITDADSTRTSTNLNHARAFSLCTKFLNAFLATHTYPASADIPDVTSAERLDLFVSNEKCTPMTVEDVEENFSHSHKKPRLMILDVLSSPQLKGRDLSDEGMENIRKTGTKVASAGVRAVAKPSGWHPEVNVGPMSKVPNRPGLVFHYFPDCVKGDSGFIPAVLSDPAFIRVLGETKQGVFDNFAVFKLGCQSWFNTEAGAMMQHAIWGVKLAADAQAQLFLLIDEQAYHGFVLLGSQFKVHTDIGWMEPLRNIDLRKSLEDLPTHTASLMAICSLLTATRITDGDHEEVRPDSITSVRDLYGYVHMRKLDEEAITTLSRLVGRLSFPAKYTDITVDSLCRALELAFTPSKVIDPLTPMYLNALGLEHDDRIYSILSQFGPTAPSFLTSGGAKYFVPHISNAIDPHSVIEEKTRRRNIEVIPVVPKELSIAIKEWKIMAEDHYVQLNQGEVAKDSRAVVFRKEARDKVWKTLREMVGKVQILPSTMMGAASTGAAARGLKVSDAVADDFA